MSRQSEAEYSRAYRARRKAEGRPAHHGRLQDKKVSVVDPADYSHPEADVRTPA